MATSIEERKQAIANVMGVSPQNATGDSGTTGETDYYTNLKNESYKTMLDAEIQANAAKDQSLKYMNNALNANGLANQGIAESSKLGLLNTYNQALASAQNAHSQNMANIGLQETTDLKQKQSDNFESLSTLLENAAYVNKDTMDKVLGDYSISVDSNGKLSGKGYDSLDAESQKQLNSLYNIYNAQLGDTSSNAQTYYEKADAVEDKTSDDYYYNLAKGNYDTIKNVGSFVQGLGSGRKNDDIDITVGYNSRNRAAQYDLLCGDVAEGTISSVLDEIATDKADGSLAIYKDKLYIYTKKGWVNVVSDHDNVEDAIKAFKELGVK